MYACSRKVPTGWDIPSSPTQDPTVCQRSQERSASSCVRSRDAWVTSTTGKFNPACSTQEMNTLSSTRRSMSRAEALSWNPNWSVGDIRVIEENLDRLAARTFFRTRSNSTVTAQDDSGRSIMYLHPGYVTFPKGLAPEDRKDLELHGFTLSTAQSRAASRAMPEETLSFCPGCFYALPATGVCDTCG